VLKGLTALAVIWTACCLAASWGPGIALAVPADIYLGSLWWRPVRRCRSCGGAKTHDSRDGRNLRRCWTCGGEGRYPRLGTKYLRRDVYDQIVAGKHGRNW
jgi:hypothetical protein